MALNASGPISLGGSTVGQSVNLELGQSATTTISFNDANVRTLTGTTAGTSLSMPGGFWGKSTGASFTITTNQKQLDLRAWVLANGWNGTLAVTVTIDTGVYIWSDDVTVAGLIIGGAWPGGLTIVNKGYILGKGGKGGGSKKPGDPEPIYYTPVPAQAGGPAVSAGANCNIVNNGYICGGGGGGGMGEFAAGGGGAGGGAGGDYSTYFLGAGTGTALGGAGGTLNGTGVKGGSIPQEWEGSLENYGAGGGGGRQIPGSGGSGGIVNPSIDYTLQQNGGFGGGAGGGGGGMFLSGISGGFNGYNGGAGNNPGVGGTYAGVYLPGAGGGGWGAAGGSSYILYTDVITTGGAGGKAVALNGNTVVISGSGTLYGAVA
jgi:hypothetical protein